MKLSDRRIEQLDELWYSFESDSGLRSPSKDTIRRFFWYMEEHDGSFSVPEIIDWTKIYFIPESISWIDDFNGRL